MSVNEIRNIEMIKNLVEKKISYREFLKNRGIVRNSRKKFMEAQYLSGTDYWYPFLDIITFQLRLRYLQHAMDLGKEQIVGMLKENSSKYDDYLGNLYSEKSVVIKEEDSVFLQKISIILDVPYHVALYKNVVNLDGDDIIEYKLLDVPQQNPLTIFESVNEDLMNSFNTKRMKTSQDRLIPLNREILPYLLTNSLNGKIILPYEAQKIPLRVDARKNDFTSYELILKSDHIIPLETINTLKKLFRSQFVFSIPAQYRTKRKLCFLTGGTDNILEYVKRFRNMPLAKIYN
ncbi:hypothetical protein [Brevibacillus centrosporus]|nr:hypothetical protein [Brevibacillus centrosporus]